MFQPSEVPFRSQAISDLANTSAAGDAGGDGVGGVGSRNGAAEIARQDGAVSTIEGSRVGRVGVGDARAAESGLARRIGRGDRVQGASQAGGLDGGGAAVEVVALGQDGSTIADLEVVTGGGTEVVVDGVQQGSALTADLGTAARGVVNIVALQGDAVRSSREVHSPVLLTVAGGRVVALAIELVVGDGYLAGGLGTEDDVLAADEGSLAVVDPDQVGTVNSDTITTPHVLSVDLGDVNVLDDDVGNAVGHAQTVSCQRMVSH